MTDDSKDNNSILPKTSQQDDSLSPIKEVLAKHKTPPVMEYKLSEGETWKKHVHDVANGEAPSKKIYKTR